MPYKPYDYADAEGKKRRETVEEKSRKLNEIQSRTETPWRPLNHMEQPAVFSLYAIGEVADDMRNVLGRRLKSIPNGKQRIGIMQWAARSLFNDVVHQLPRPTLERFVSYSQNMAVKVSPKSIGKPQPWQQIIWEEDLCDIAAAAWRNTCMMCEKKGKEASECKLKRALDRVQILDTSDNPDCWYRMM